MSEGKDAAKPHVPMGQRLGSTDIETSKPPKMLTPIIDKATQLIAFGAVASVVLFAFKALWVARMDIHVATALVTNTTLATAFQVIAVTLIPTLCYLGSAILYYVYAPRLRAALRAVWRQEETSTLALVGDLMTKIFIPVTALGLGTLLLWVLVVRVSGFFWQSMTINFVISICPILAILFLRFFQTKRSIPRTLPKLFVLYTSFLAVYVLGSALASPSMWLPPEQVTTTNGSFVMYILKADNERLTAFIPSNRAVVQIAAEEVTARQFCSPYFRVDLAATLWGNPVMPSCFFDSNYVYPLDYSHPDSESGFSGPRPPDQLP